MKAWHRHGTVTNPSTRPACSLSDTVETASTDFPSIETDNDKSRISSMAEV